MDIEDGKPTKPANLSWSLLWLCSPNKCNELTKRVLCFNHDSRIFLIPNYVRALNTQLIIPSWSP